MKYNFKNFEAQFPDDAACLEFLFRVNYGENPTCDCGKSGCFHRRTKRRCYSCAFCGAQIFPTAGTIFHKSSTSLKSWFFAMFLMAQSRNGVAAKEIQRQVGVTYKTAWRMNRQIRKLMAGGGSLLTGVVEADETYIGGVRPGKRGRGAAGKTAVVGVVERHGSVRAKVVENVNTASAMTHLRKVTAPEITVVTDESNVYNLTEKFGFRHLAINHGAGEYVRGDVHTNTIEGFWSQVKRSVDGTYHSVSRKFLQSYVDEFAFRYNHRKSAQPMFSLLVERAGEQLVEAV